MKNTDKQHAAAMEIERALRQWAHGIIAELPHDEEDSRRVLVLAREMFEDSLSSRSLQGKKKRKAA